MEPIRSTGLEKYLSVVGGYDNEFAKWQSRVKKILKRYRDDTRGQTGNESAKFNILWSNVQTLIPAVYARLPKADVSRRFGDNDPIGRVASNLIERAIDFEIEHYPDFRATMKHCVEDRFLGGRGVAWVRYEPHVKAQEMPDDGLEVTEDIEPGESAEGEMPEEIEYECAPIDYVHWRDFGHATARTWEEVTCVWRWVYMGYDALVERFGEEKAKKIPMDQGPEPLNAYNESKKSYNRAKICELWDKETLKVYWFSKSVPDFIDVRDDPLNLEGFFPCGKPLYATTTSDSLVPVPDFVLYQDQAMELDILSDRIDGLVKALRVRGVYDASQPALQRLLTEGDNNSLIPVDKWMAFSEKGGLKGSIDLLPLDTLAAALMQCYQARDNIKSQIYEITGISDIIRGASYASETATAQQIKGQYAGLRLRAMQEDVALFASELIRLKAQVMCSKFQDQTILAFAAAEQMQPVDQQVIPQALQLIRNKPLRSFRIEVAADSLVQLDEQQTKQDRLEFLQAFGGFMQQALPIAQQTPELVPMMVEMVKFGVGAFKQARQLEGVIDKAIQDVQQAGQQQKPDPEAQKAQAQAQAEQMKMQAQSQIEQGKAQLQAQIEQAKMQQEAQLEQMKLQHEAQIAAQKQQHESNLKTQELAQKENFERWKAELDSATRIEVAKIGKEDYISPDQEMKNAETETFVAQLGSGLQDAINNMAAAHQGMAIAHQATMDKLGEVMGAMHSPKRIVRGPDGRAVGVESVPMSIPTTETRQ
jgi:F0F1-type ATP synthase membrane subunit b/b'